MKETIKSLNDTYSVTNVLGHEIHSSAEIMAWNNLFLILLAIAALMVMVNKLDPKSINNNIYDKILYGGLSISSLAGLFYPIEFGLLGVNIYVTIILVAEYLRYDKTTKKNKW
jgi:hypothetical protein